MEYVATTGKEVKLSCRVEKAPDILLEYHWFQCEPDGSGKQPTKCFENEMTLMATAANKGHYVCNVTAIDLDSIISDVARVMVVNSTDITVEPGGEPPSERYLEFGDSLVLEFKAVCKHYPIKYQWYCNGTVLPSGTESKLILHSIAEGNMGSYLCEASSDYSEKSVLSRTCRVQWS